MKENKLNNFEQKLHDKINDASFDYHESHWAQLKPKISSTNSTVGFSSLIKVAIVVILSTTGIYYVVSNDDKPIENIQKESNFANSKNQLKNTKEVPKKDLIADQELNIPIDKSENKTEEVAQVKNEENKNSSDKKLVHTEEVAPIASENRIEPTIDIATEFTEIDKPVKNQSSTEINELIIEGSLCIGNTIQIYINSKENSEENYNWEIDGQKLNHTSSKLDITIKNSGLKHIFVSNEISVKDIEIEVFEIPEIDFTYNDLVDPFWDEAAELNATPENLSYTWEIESMESSIQGNNQIVDFSNKGFYNVNLVYIDKNGCEYNKEKPVSILSDFDPLAPNAFTPDGDNLNNDFIPLGFSETQGHFTMSIFDLNWNLVYKTVSKEEPWNGKMNNRGTKLPNGTYIWKVEISHENRNKAFAGQFKLLNL